MKKMVMLSEYLAMIVCGSRMWMTTVRTFQAYIVPTLNGMWPPSDMRCLRL